MKCFMVEEKFKKNELLLFYIDIGTGEGIDFYLFDDYHASDFYKRFKIYIKNKYLYDF